MKKQFEHFDICDSLATHLEVGTGNFVREYQRSHPDERAHFPVIAKEILRCWNRTAQDSLTVGQRLDCLNRVLSEDIDGTEAYKEFVKIRKVRRGR